MTFTGKHNEQYITGRELGKGGEGCVFELNSHPELVLKKYNEPLSTEKIRKLELMVAMRSPSIEAYAAWPVDLIKDDKGEVCGFVMKKLAGYVPLHHVFSPMDRKRMFPDKGYNFLAHVARNVAIAFHKLHEAGLVVGDVNEGNILINSFGMAAFIDCDSFQVKDEQQYFFCEVGVPRYTPPELLKKQSFEKVIRTVNTDSFSLAVLIFQLLFLGRHPFAGKHKGHSDIDEETAIRQRQFAYSLDNPKRKLSPPPNSFEISNLPEQLVTMFHGAFEQDERPVAAEWVKALDILLAEMTSCQISKLHAYPSRMQECPWCKFRKENGIMYFLDDSYFEAQSVLGNIESFINGYRPEKLILNKPDLHGPIAGVKPLPIKREYYIANRKRKILSFSLVAIGIFLGIIERWESVFFLAFAYFAYKHSPWANQLRKELNNLLSQHKALLTKLKKVTVEYENTSDMAIYSRTMDALQKLIHEFGRLPEELERRKKAAEDVLYNEQLDDYLYQFSIAESEIPGIGPAKKNALADNGIRRASHIHKLQTIKVPGIGPSYAQVLINWRRQMATGFVYIPDTYKVNLAMQKVKEEIAQLKYRLEDSIRREYQSLNFLKANIRNKAAIMENQIKEIRTHIRQTELNIDAFRKIAA